MEVEQSVSVVFRVFDGEALALAQMAFRVEMFADDALCLARIGFAR